jgi:hypothetical protein
MLVIRVELHSAITGVTSEIARMIIANDGTGTTKRGNYWGRTAKGVIKWDKMIPAAIMHDVRKMDHAEVKGYPRASKHVWNLVSRMLSAMGYK